MKRSKHISQITYLIVNSKLKTTPLKLQNSLGLITQPINKLLNEMKITKTAKSRLIEQETTSGFYNQKAERQNWQR